MSSWGDDYKIRNISAHQFNYFISKYILIHTLYYILNYILNIIMLQFWPTLVKTFIFSNWIQVIKKIGSFQQHHPHSIICLVSIFDRYHREALWSDDLSCMEVRGRCTIRYVKQLSNENNPEYDMTQLWLDQSFKQTCSLADCCFSTLGGGGLSTGPSSMWADIGAGLDSLFSEAVDPLDNRSDELRLESRNTTEDSSSVKESSKPGKYLYELSSHTEV